ncbi:type VII secretion protein EccE [Catenulispora rubra]|uniref:type VII secretion protein EccE n=1 Tax=Catenulispora rubra TaxID=280293 RepID=UPI001892237D|nr:type VII secretion protein EccE [Catenulispora rubra]
MSDRPIPKRRPGFFSTSSFLRLAVCEAAIAGGLAASGRTRSAVGVALLLVAMTVARRDGRWWVEHRAVVRGFRRRGAARPGSHPDPRLTALRALAPGLTVGSVENGQTDVGVACDGDGWFAVAAFSGSEQIGVDPDPGAADARDRLFPDLVAVLRDSGLPGAAVQLVTHTVPVPAPNLDPDCAAAVSYRELTRLVGTVPAERSQWLAVRVDVAGLAGAGVRQADQAPAILAGLARRLARAASRYGSKATVLDAEGMVRALSYSAGMSEPATDSADGAAPHEQWDAWHPGRVSNGAGARGLAHRTFWLRDWPNSSGITGLLDDLACTPAVLTRLALTITADPASSDSVDVRCLIRIATKPGDLANASADLEAVARSMGAELVALDGEQVPATYASLPTGGGPR